MDFNSSIESLPGEDSAAANEESNPVSPSGQRGSLLLASRPWRLGGATQRAGAATRRSSGTRPGVSSDPRAETMPPGSGSLLDMSPVDEEKRRRAGSGSASASATESRPEEGQGERTEANMIRVNSQGGIEVTSPRKWSVSAAASSPGSSGPPHRDPPELRAAPTDEERGVGNRSDAEGERSRPLPAPDLRAVSDDDDGGDVAAGINGNGYDDSSVEEEEKQGRLPSSRSPDSEVAVRNVGGESSYEHESSSDEEPTERDSDDEEGRRETEQPPAAAAAPLPDPSPAGGGFGAFEADWDGGGGAAVVESSTWGDPTGAPVAGDLAGGNAWGEASPPRAVAGTADAAPDSFAAFGANFAEEAKGSDPFGPSEGTEQQRQQRNMNWGSPGGAAGAAEDVYEPPSSFGAFPTAFGDGPAGGWDDVGGEQKVERDEDDARSVDSDVTPPPSPPVDPAIIEELGDDAVPATYDPKFKPLVELQSRLIQPGYVLKKAPMTAPSSSSPEVPPPLPVPAPNPLTGNLLVCRRNGESLSIDELDVAEPLGSAGNKPAAVVATAPILTPDLRRRCLSSFGKSPYGVASVAALAAGVHRQQGRSRVRVAAVLDLLALCPNADSSASTKGGKSGASSQPPAKTETLRVVAVYQWGYAGLSGGRRPVALQNVLGPPSPNVRAYVPTTLCVADGLLFLAGTGRATSTSGGRPCVFLAKPQVRDVWSAQTVADAPSPGGNRGTPSGGGGREVSAIAVTAHSHRSYRYLAVALTDGTIGVWTYELAVTTNRISATGAGGGAEKAQKLLQPLCRLEGSVSLEALPDTLPLTEGAEVHLAAVEEATTVQPRQRSPSPERHHCTHLSFLPPGAASSSLLLLAAAFPHGLAVYHVSLPLVVDLRPIPTDSISELSTTSDERDFSVQGTRKGRNNKVGKGRQSGAASAAVSATAQGEKKQTTLLAQTALISPFAAARGWSASVASAASDSKGAKGSGTATTSTATAAWLDLGPRCPPTLALAVESSSSPASASARVLLCAVDLPLFGSPSASGGGGGGGGGGALEGPCPIRALCARSMLPPLSLSSATIAVGAAPGAALRQRGDTGEIVALTPSLASRGDGCRPPFVEDAHFASLSRPVSSRALDLDGGGFVCSEGENAEANDVLHVYSVLQSRRKNLRDLPMPTAAGSGNSGGGGGGGSGNKSGGKSLHWTTPVLRHWLCRASPGDRKGDARNRERAAGGGGAGAGAGGAPPSDGLSTQFGDEVATGGADACAVCELTCAESEGGALTPQRIVREVGGGGTRCAVLFGSVLGGCGAEGANVGRGGARVAPDPIAFAILDASPDGSGTQHTFKLHRGRDVVFVPPSFGSVEDPGYAAGAAIVLSWDGRSLRELRWSTPSEGDSANGEHDGSAVLWNDGKEVPIFGDGYFEAASLSVQRIFTLSFSSKPSSGPFSRLLYVASRQPDNRTFLLLGRKHLNVIGDDATVSELLPREDGKGARFWLKDGEDIVSLVELPYEENCSDPCIAMATQQRIVIFSARTLSVLAESPMTTTCTSLVSIGSHCVAFCSASTAAGGGDAKIRYLSCADGHSAGFEISRAGIIATIPSARFGHAPYLLIGVRPDRLLYLSSHNGTRLAEHGEDENIFLLPVATTRPAFPLEPLVANALRSGDGTGTASGDLANDVEVQTLLRNLFERFGRKTAPFPHGEGEGIGNLGTGLTSRTYEMLIECGCQEAATFLLTGSAVQREKAVKSKMLPPWVPMATKVRSAMGVSAKLQALASGDQYLAEYLSSPDDALVSNLPRTSDTTSVLAQRLGLEALGAGRPSDAIRLLDLAGGASSESAILLSTLSYQLRSNADTEKLLQTISGGGLARGVEVKENRGSLSSVAAIALERKQRRAVPSHWMKQLAPSVQKGRVVVRERNRLVGHSAIPFEDQSVMDSLDTNRIWQQSPEESKHFWSKGPFDQKEELLLLDRFEEWLGRRRPTIVGKEGVAAAAETGEKALADILLAAQRDQDDEGGDDDEESLQEGWIEGIGEGHSDEDNLSAYFRFSEGGDEDSTWRSDGVTDLTKYSNNAIIFSSDSVSLEATTSSVDEGEAGKVRLLYDLVFNEDIDRDRSAGMLIEVKRGSSVDVGMLHSADHDSRKKSSVEFWYHLPPSIDREIVLARRSVCPEEDDISKLCVPSSVEDMLWELVVMTNGRLQFRSSGGSVVTSGRCPAKSATQGTQHPSQHRNEDDSDEEEKDIGLVSWQREDGYGGWNHCCLIFNSRSQANTTDCSVTLLMKGKSVATAVASVVPPGLESGQSTEFNELDEAMEKTALMLGLGPPTGFRMTELRVWSCERNEDDVKMMMSEYLRAAEIRKKFKVKIRNRQSASPTKALGAGFLAPPKTGKTVRLAQPEKAKTTFLAPPAADIKKKDNTTEEETKESISENFGFDVAFHSLGDANEKSAEDGTTAKLKAEEGPAFAESAFSMDFGVNEDFAKHAFPSEELQKSNTPDESMQSSQSLLVLCVEKTSLLSKKVRSSAAAAIIRGPPATRHFGGNRGGLHKPSFKPKRESRRTGVGSVAICGAEKTVIYTHDQSPPGKTYPIGASGAIISDVMDSEGSEYLCCFLAKEKRMVVFELISKTVVVELQMATKLNFWRYLPPAAHGDTLCFMLVTPVGGFHWMPLDESPRPRQAWKRGPELQGKKIVSHEEGGSNGSEGPEKRSSLALLLASSSTSGSPVEAWCLPVYGNSEALCLSEDILSAALFRPLDLEKGQEFLPHLVMASRGENNDVVVDIIEIELDQSGNFERGSALASAKIENIAPEEIDIPEPTMAMGTLPPLLCCCIGEHVVVIIRNIGFVSAYEFSGKELSLVGQKDISQFVIDAAVRVGTSDKETEIVLLLCDTENTKDGCVATVTLSPSLAMC